MSTRTGRPRHLSVVPSPSGTDPRDGGDSSTDSESAMGRRHRLTNVVLRVSVDDVQPPVWRRIRVRSDLLLSELHGVLQVSLGWQDRHLHAFSLRSTGFTRRFEMETGERDSDCETSSEERTRISDVLDESASSFTYEYNLGDGWTHTVALVEVDPDIDDLRSVCLDGAGACPPEGIGSPSSYCRALDIAGDPSHPRHGAVVQRLGPSFDPDRFEIDRVNRALRSLDAVRSVLAEAVSASPAVGRLFDRVRPTRVPALMALLPRCELTIESTIDFPVAQIAMGKLIWLLDRVGSDGAALTAAGYLEPTFVAAIRDELDWGLGWVGSGTREIDNHQVTDLREAARGLGLIKTVKGRLSRTKLGDALADDPVALWRHAASKLPFGKDSYETDAGTLFLISLAASASAEHRSEMFVETVTELGWGSPQTDEFDAQFAAQATVSFLDLIGAHGPTFYFRPGVSDSPSWSRRFARDALLS